MLIHVTQKIIDNSGKASHNCIVHNAVFTAFPDKDEDGNYITKVGGCGFSSIAIDDKFYKLPDNVIKIIHDWVEKEIKPCPFSFELEYLIPSFQK